MSDKLTAFISSNEAKPQNFDESKTFEIFSSIKKDLSILSSKVNCIESKLNSSPSDDIVLNDTQYVPLATIEPNTTSPHHNRSTEDPCKPFLEYVPDAIPQETKEELLKLTSELGNEFKKISEGQSREVLYFGDYSYKYTGKEHCAKPMPAQVTKLLNDIRPQLPDPNIQLNSCLVSRYASGGIGIPFHRDDEPVIDPTSSILTVSLGTNRTMKFINNAEDKSVEQVLEDGSLLVTSRFAQDFWKHSISEDDSVGVRYSFTFRNISPHYLNSTIVLGDSNTKFLQFGEGKGTLGAWMPGKTINVGHIESLPNATDIGPYRNIIIHTGINNIANSQQRKSDNNLVNILESKCNEIMSVYPKTKIHISTLLPTRSDTLNYRIKQFNDKLLDMTYRLKNVNVIDNSMFGNLLTDEHGRWDINADKPLRRDILHLGKKGLRLLAKNFKSCVINKGKSQPRARFNVGSGQYRQAVVRGSLRGGSTTQSSATTSRGTPKRSGAMRSSHHGGHNGNRFSPLADHHDD